MEESYKERYDRLKKDGVIPAVIFVEPIGEERYVPLTDKQVPGISEGTYEVSNYGNIINTYSGDYVNQRADKQGYKIASISTNSGSKNKRVHRLVLSAFDYRPDFETLQVNHSDGNPSNNKLNNLEWSTAKENSNHAMLFGLHKMAGSENPNNKLTEDQVREICELIQSGKYYDTEIAEMYNVSYTNISDIHKGKIWPNISKDYDLSKRKPLTLTPDQVREICEMLETGNYFTTEIAKKFNTSHQNIIDIRKGRIWKDISKDYNIVDEHKPKKFTKDQVREICELIQSGKYYDTEIAAMYNTTAHFLYSLRKGICHKDITKDYDLTVRKSK